LELIIKNHKGFKLNIKTTEIKYLMNYIEYELRMIRQKHKLLTLCLTSGNNKIDQKQKIVNSINKYSNNDLIKDRVYNMKMNNLFNEILSV
jgi:hypothetical protein